MKLVRYETYPEEKLEVKDYSGTPYLRYEECSGGLRLEVVVEDDLVYQVEEALKGDLPDSVFSVLGIDVEGEDLEEICEALKERGFVCELERRESDEEYCESIYVKLSSATSKAIKVVIENGSLRTFPAPEGKHYVKYRSDGRRRRLEAVVPSTALSVLEGAEDKIRALVTSVIPSLKEADLDDPVSVVEALENEEDYRVCIERRGDTISWYIE